MEFTRRRVLELLGYGGALLAAGPRLVFAKGKSVLRTELTDRYDLRYPIVGAGIGFYALPELVAAISNAGGLGVLGAAPEPPPRLQLLIQQVKAMTNRSFGVDLVNTRIFGGTVPAVTDEHIEVCVQEKVKIVVFFWDTPPAAWVDRLHSYGAKVWMQVGSVEGALAALDVGVDALIAQGAEAGGHHRGEFEGTPIPRAELVGRLKEVAGGRMVLSAGGITDGQGLADALLEGAEGAWVGTRFVMSLESYAHDEYKRRVIEVTSPDQAVVTTMFGPEWSGVTIAVVRNRVVNEWAGREDEIPYPPPPPAVIGTTLLAGQPYNMPKFSAILPTRDTAGDFEEMALAAGPVSSARIHDIKPAAQIVEEMSSEAQTILEAQL